MVTLPWWSKIEWRNVKILYWLCAVEFPFTVAGLALYGIADPNTYRTDLWTEGGKHGWSSSPADLVLAYANYKPVKIPAPYDQFITTFNVVVIVLSLFMLLAKTVMYITHVFPPFFSALIHAALTILYAYSVSQQAGSDNITPGRTAKVPWYLTRGCGAPVDPGLKGYCQQAEAGFAIAVCLTALFFVHTVIAIIYAVPTAAQKESYETEKQADAWMHEKTTDYEMDHVPQTPGSPMYSPMTPRTMAFNTLDGTLSQHQHQHQHQHQYQQGGRTNKDLPLRHHISMGDEFFVETQRETFKSDR